MGGKVIDEVIILQQLKQTPQVFDRIKQVEGSALQVQKQLRKEFPDEIVRAALTLADLRKRATVKFQHATEMWFNRVGLEQSTSEAVAKHKAKRFSGNITDYCCGIGSDAIAMSAHGEVTAVDSNPAACLRTEYNAEIHNISQAINVIAADVTRLTHTPGLLHIDPDRRPNARGKTVRIEDAVPGLEFLQTLPNLFEGGAIKVSPAGNFAGKFQHVEQELISLNGECKEATIWFGELAGAEEWRATVLPAGESIAGDPLDAYAEVKPLGNYIYDPDPAVVRSGLLNLLAEREGLSRLDAAEEYLTSDQLVTSPFVRPFAVQTMLPNNDREIRNWFRNSEIGNVEIKCRHIPVMIEAVRRKLPLAGNKSAVLFFARLAGKSRAVIAHRIPVI